MKIKMFFLFCFFVGLFFFVQKYNDYSKKSFNTIGLKEGMLAPDFSIHRLNGSLFTLSEYKDKKAVYIVFWTTWCSFCLKKVPKLKEIQKFYSEQIEIIAINTGLKDSLVKMKGFKKKYAINYPLTFDTKKKITDLYDVRGVPTEYIIDINGRIVHDDNVPEDISKYLKKWNKNNVNLK
jgi:peroxiredoxin